jgi:hypothetical protein
MRRLITCVADTFTGAHVNQAENPPSCPSKPAATAKNPGLEHFPLFALTMVGYTFIST